MKRRLFWCITLILVLMTSTASAIQILPKDGTYEHKEVAPEPIVTPDPRAVQLGAKKDDLIENGELEDRGTVWISWNGKVYSLYGCALRDDDPEEELHDATKAKMNYTNPLSSNIGVTLKLAIFDNKMMEYFGTTYRSVSEQIELAKTGLAALENGISLGTAYTLVENTDYFEDMTFEEVNALSREELCEILGSKNFIGKNADELYLLEESDLEGLTEAERLELATLGIYNPLTYSYIIAENGLINPGNALYETDLMTLPDGSILPKGEYEGVFVLNGYAADKNEMSDMFVNLPITIIIREDMPEELLDVFGLTLALRIDEN